MLLFTFGIAVTALVLELLIAALAAVAFFRMTRRFRRIFAR